VERPHKLYGPILAPLKRKVGILRSFVDVELITWTCIKDALANSIDAVADISFLKTWFARLRPDKGDQVRA
jgi:hypothetical protein